MASRQNDERLDFIFDPPTGGDVLLRSKDERTFCVHSVILGLASSVFLDMFSIGRPSGEPIQLDDDSESISLLLAFIYPSSIWPTVRDIDTLEKCLMIGQKYNVEKIPQALDRDLSQLSEANIQLIIRQCRDPLRIFRLAVTHGLRNCQTLAAKSITPGVINLLKPAEIVKVAEEYPHMAHVIGLVSVQAVRTKILADVLFKFAGGFPDFLPTAWKPLKRASKNQSLTDSRGSGLMMCDECVSQSPELQSHSVDEVYYFPSWVHAWSRAMYTDLCVTSLDECERLFKLSSFNWLVREEPGVCDECVDAAIEASRDEYERPGEVYENWASNIKAILTRELEQLDVLYSL
ncbi:hypothetical protein FRC09_004388 [Ceratobasidium sp. 395]|nr:hypothetical protein FRC09_004388 [Ceratobasidium sp. 395]